MQNNFREVTFPQVFPLAPSHTNQLNLRSSALAQQDLKFFFFFIFPPCTGKTNRRSYDTKEVTSERKYSLCLTSAALRTNSLKGRVLKYKYSNSYSESMQQHMV